MLVDFGEDNKPEVADKYDNWAVRYDVKALSRQYELMATT